MRVTDTAAVERMAARLTREFLRRTARRACAVGAEEGWPFSDLAGALDPQVEVDRALRARAVPDAAYEPVLTLFDRVALEPAPIDDATLTALDEENEESQVERNRRRASQA